MPEEINTGEVVYLDPERVRVFRTGGDTLRLTVEGDRSYLRVSARRGFPFSHPRNYISLRDGAEKEIGMVRDLHQLGHESRHLVEEELRRRYLVPRIEKVNSAKREFGMAYFDVETDKGRREFVVRSVRDSMVELSASRLLITDNEGNRYEIPDLYALDPKWAALIEEWI